jgi:hypothetical protein
MGRKGRIAGIALLGLTSLLGAGCAAWAAIAPVVVAVISAIADAIPIVDEVVGFIDRHFSASPDPAAQAKLNGDVARCRAALVHANRAVTDTDTPPGKDEAMAEFRKEWSTLTADLRKLDGVESVPGATAGSGFIALRDKKSGATLSVPQPLGATEEPEQ